MRRSWTTKCADRSRLTSKTELLRRGFATLILSTVTVVVATGNGFGQIAIVDEDRQPGGTATREPPPDWVKEATRDWMASIPDGAKLYKISIPGTHESAALYGELVSAKCQSWSIKDQLEAGIRYLDIRVKPIENHFSVYHGKAPQKQRFGDVMKTVTGFLREHPSETVLMRVKEEKNWDAPWDKSFRRIWENSYMSGYGKYVWDNGGSDEIPSLGQVRGKIVVLRDNIGIKNGETIPSHWGLEYDYGEKINPCGLRAGSFMEIQDCYRVSKEGVGIPISLETKRRLIGEYIDKAGVASNHQLVLNHLSGVNFLGDGPDMSPLGVARETNPSTYDYIGDYEGPQTLGVVIMDYPGPRLVYRIVKSNLRIVAKPEPPKPGQKFIPFRSPPVGGDGGGAWDFDSAETVNQGNVSKVKICHGAYIDSIQLYYAGKQGRKVGGPGGSCDSWPVPPGEFITKIVVRHGKLIDSLQFVTNKGTESDSFGGTGGKYLEISDEKNKGALQTIRARAGRYVDKLEFVFGFPSFIKDVEYDLDAASRQLVLSAPQEIARQELRNDTDVPQQAIYKSTISRTETHWVSFGKALELGLTGELSIGIPKLGAEAKVSVSATTKFSAEEGNEKSETVTLEWGVPVNIPSRQVIIATSSVREATLRVPFTYTVAYYQNGNRSDIVKEEKYNGVYEGVQLADLTHHYKQVP